MHEQKLVEVSLTRSCSTPRSRASGKTREILRRSARLERMETRVRPERRSSHSVSTFEASRLQFFFMEMNTRSRWTRVTESSTA
jgi:hypothetical protein